MKSKPISSAGLISALLLSACGGGEQASTLASQTSDLEASNGSSLNGSSLNGSSLNGSSLNGSSLNGVSLNGSSLNGSSLNGVTLSGSQLVSVSSSGRLALSGAGLVGARLNGQLSTGGDLPLRIDSAVTGTGANADVWFYGVSYQAGGHWQPLCGLDAVGKPVPAVAVLGTWDPRQGVAGGGSYTYSNDSISFGCHAMGAIAKCVELGYKPWKSAPDGSGSLRDHHVACTRLIRADYCGDGESHTINGRLIDVFDGVGVQSPAGGGLLALWLLEGEWSPEGARCISPLVNDRYFKAGILPPKCLLSLISLTCGAKAHLVGPVLMNRDKLF